MSAVRELRIVASDLIRQHFGMKSPAKFLIDLLGVPYDKASVFELDERQLRVVIETLRGRWHRCIPDVIQPRATHLLRP